MPRSKSYLPDGFETRSARTCGHHPMVGNLIGCQPVDSLVADIDDDETPLLGAHIERNGSERVECISLDRS